MLNTRDYDYLLPDSLIARWPLPDRAASRMMTLHRGSQEFEHRAFTDFPNYLREGDLVVLNDTKVIPARVFSDDGKIEILFFEQLTAVKWRCLVKPGRKMTLGKTVGVDGVPGEVTEVLPNGDRIIAFQKSIDLEKSGKIPLPHYMGRESDATDVERYQTVYARSAGAVAAPTAGLHFTHKILEAIPHTFITLHVGPGTFKPVQTEKITDHRMHAEHFVITPEAAKRINLAKKILAIGTTTVRVLESRMAHDDRIVAGEGATDIFIHPPYKFRIVNGLLTNFHLPKSTLLMLVSAFAGREFVLKAYTEAIRERYRFYSYGDCMLITD